MRERLNEYFVLTLKRKREKEGGFGVSHWRIKSVPLSLLCLVFFNVFIMAKATRTGIEWYKSWSSLLLQLLFTFFSQLSSPTCWRHTKCVHATWRSTVPLTQDKWQQNKRFFFYKKKLPFFYRQHPSIGFTLIWKKKTFIWPIQQSIICHIWAFPLCFGKPFGLRSKPPIVTLPRTIERLCVSFLKFCPRKIIFWNFTFFESSSGMFCYLFEIS